MIAFILLKNNLSLKKMGYEIEILQKLIDKIISIKTNFSGLQMLEFGNQEIYGRQNYVKCIPLFNKYNYLNNSSILKYFFEYLGMNHTSIDYNGKDGALRLDVRTDLTSQLTGRFDILTNVGFSEHVGENTDPRQMLDAQYNFFKNMHNLGKIDSLYYHCVPLTHNWYKHGVCDYSLSFFEALCEKSGYLIIEGPFIETYHPEKQASIFFKKMKDDEFMTFDTFCSLPGLRSTASD